MTDKEPALYTHEWVHERASRGKAALADGDVDVVYEVLDSLSDYTPTRESRRTIRTEDGVEVGEGDRVYGFHSQMTVGTIRPGSMGPEERVDVYHDRLMQGSTQPWFTVDFDNGKSELLNGQRVCSVEHARRKGWVQ